VKSALSELEAVNAALCRAVTYLTSKRGQDGLWRDFRTLAGESSEWVTGYVCEALAETESAAPLVGLATRRLIARQRTNGGWGYNRQVPTDADSTAWTLLALSSVAGWRPSAAVRGTRFLIRHQHGDTGGISTYHESDQIHHYIKSNYSAVTGWTLPHVCVTAASLLALSVHKHPDERVLSRASSYVLDAQDAEGSWTGYWWKGIAYPTAVATRALVASRAASPALLRRVCDMLHDRAERGRSWADAPDIGESAFSIALASRTLLLCRPVPNGVVREAICYLLDTQLPNGSWQSEPIMRIPPPGTQTPALQHVWRVNAPGTGVVLSDINQIFVTATVVAALTRFRELHSAYLPS
jgi:squalene-hopene/tetraprenyl-beta-curcumene cyclase